MADLVITDTAVIAATGSDILEATAGATITAGQTIYLDSSDSNSAKLADADASSATAACVGIALNGASDGQPVKYITYGNLTLNAVLTAGVIYVLSGTAGGIAPSADLGSGDNVVILGCASSTTVLKVKLWNTGCTV